MRARVIRVGLLAAVAVGGMLSSAAAADGARMDSESLVEFGSWSGDPFEDVFYSLTGTNETEQVEQFLAAQLKSGSPADIPGLENLSTSDRMRALRVALLAVEGGGILRAELLPSGARSIRLSEGALAKDLLTRRSHQASQGPNMSIASFSSAPVKGSAVNNRFSWRYTQRYNWTECKLLTCQVRSWIEYRMTTEPGWKGSRTTLNISKYGTQLSKIIISSYIYANDTRIHTNSLQTWNSGSGV